MGDRILASDAVDFAGYTAAQAERLLSFVEVKTPGLLAAAEKTLREHGLWPDEGGTDE